MFIAVLFSVAKTWKQLKWPSTEEWIKMWQVYTHTHTYIYTNPMEYHSAVKKNKTMPFAATWMCLEIVILNAMIPKEKNMPYAITYVELTIWC